VFYKQSRLCRFFFPNILIKKTSTPAPPTSISPDRAFKFVISPSPSSSIINSGTLLQPSAKKQSTPSYEVSIGMPLNTRCSCVLKVIPFPKKDSFPILTLDFKNYVVSTSRSNRSTTKFRALLFAIITISFNDGFAYVL
jgi:hypothetical protein